MAKFCGRPLWMAPNLLRGEIQIQYRNTTKANMVTCRYIVLIENRLPIYENSRMWRNRSFVITRNEMLGPTEYFVCIQEVWKCLALVCGTSCSNLLRGEIQINGKSVVVQIITYPWGNLFVRHKKARHSALSSPRKGP